MKNIVHVSAPYMYNFRENYDTKADAKQRYADLARVCTKRAFRGVTVTVNYGYYKR